MLEKIKTLLDIALEEKSLDAKLNLLIELASLRLKGLLGGIEPPDELKYIIVEVCVARYNRIGSEGLASHSVEGESMTFKENDFEGFKEDIQEYLNTKEESKKGKLRFL